MLLRTLLPTAAAALLALPASAATILSVGDGDTLRVSENGRRLTIRLACIDAPETAQRPYGSAATQALKALAPVGSIVSLRVQTTDRYGRTVAELITPGGSNINLALVRKGHAFAYRKYLAKCDRKAYLSAERQAQGRGTGVWSGGGITRPWDFRRGRRSASGSGTGSSQRRRYRCKDIGSWSKAQQLLKEGHSYLDRDRDGEACESLR